MSEQVKDVVCGMDITTDTKFQTMEHGETYIFFRLLVKRSLRKNLIPICISIKKKRTALPVLLWSMRM